MENMFVCLFVSWNGYCHFQQIQANFVVVIHPGSKTLRMGRATDTLPISVPHVIARRHKQPGQPRHEDPCLLRDGLNVRYHAVMMTRISANEGHQWLIVFECVSSCSWLTLQCADSNEQRQNGLKMIDQVIWSRKMSNGVRRTPVSAEQVRHIENESISADLCASTLSVCVCVFTGQIIQQTNTSCCSRAKL